MQISLKNHLFPAIKSKRRGRLSTGALLQHDNVRSHTARSTVAAIQVCPLSVFHIRRTRQTSAPMTFMSLDRSKRRLETSLSGQTKRCSKRCTSGCTLSQKNFFWRYACTSEALEHLYGAQWRLHRNMKSLCTFVFNKLRDKNI